MKIPPVKLTLKESLYYQRNQLPNLMLPQPVDFNNHLLLVEEWQVGSLTKLEVED